MKKILVSVLIVCLVMSIGTAAFAASANFKANFPLPANTTYNITVLNKYSSGSQHSSYINQYVLNKGGAPKGIVMDIAAGKGTDVYAVLSGKVITAKFFSSGGNAVVIKHDDGSYSYYGHMTSYTVKQGDKVKTGDRIGYVGSTGSGSTGNHLHFEWSGHDVYSQFYALGLVKIMNKSGASKYPPSHVHAYDGVGKCACGEKYPIMLTSMSKKATVVKVNGTKTAPMHTAPYGDASIPTRLKLNDTVTITDYCWNHYGNLWYKVKDAKGNTGYVVSGYLQLK